MILAAWAEDVAKAPKKQRAVKLPFDGEKQAKALAHYQGEADLDATMAARLVGLSYPQYNRYLWGKVPLRTDQLTLFASAYGITTAELSLALGLLDDAVDPALLARVRDAVGSIYPDETARAIEREFRTKHLRPEDVEMILADISDDQTQT